MRLSRGKLLLLVPVIVVAVYVLADRREAAAQEARLGMIASKIAGRPVEVRCQGRVSAALDVTRSRERSGSTPPGDRPTGPI